MVGRKKTTPPSPLRSSTAEYLIFVAATGGQAEAVEMRYEDENIWLTQKMMATLYDVSAPAINQHLKRIFADRELEPEATVKKYLIVQTEGSRTVQREIAHYSLQAIIAVGFKIENERAVQDAGKVSAELARQHAETEFEKYRIVQDRLFQSDFDRAFKLLESGGAPHAREDAK
jgi:hypothetical protein